jgi:anti-sigma B factor antagonist
MGNSTATLHIATVDETAFIKICGRASYTSSGEFKQLIIGLLESKTKRFVLELSNCLIMDSTFLGILARIGIDLSESTNKDNLIILLNPNDRILDALANLEVAELFQISNDPDLSGLHFSQVKCDSKAFDKSILAKNSIIAHETLMAINPANIPKFKDVTKFLKEDLAKKESS